MVENFDDVFAGPVVLEMGAGEYTKKAGDSDTRNQYDEI